MKLCTKRSAYCAIRRGFVVVAGGCLIATALAGGQPASPQSAPVKQPMAEDVFKNVQVLKGIPVDQFMGTMGIIAASLSVNCTECHVGDFAADTPRKTSGARAT